MHFVLKKAPFMKYILLSSFLSISILGACGIQTDVKQQTASHIARPAFMVERTIATDSFNLEAWERMHKRHDVATIYIGGDTDSQLGNKTTQTGFSLFKTDATRRNPVGLHLASRDKADNLAYLYRPCQNIKFPEDKGCEADDWHINRYAPAVVQSYQSALDDIAARYDISGFHLVGYDGGANIAGILAGTRKDILTLRTVAGDLNPRFIDNNALGPVGTSAVLAVDYARALSQIPQHHFIGAADQIITPGTYHSYRQAVGLSDCMHYSVIQDADHTNGWVEKWGQLSMIIPQCAVIHAPETPLPDLLDFPGNYHKGKGFKK